MRDEQYWASLAHELRALPRETGWLEFKHNNAEPQEIGEYISALANTAALEGKAHAYLLWGVDDATHQAIGTTFDPALKRIGNEELESWLLRQLAPKIGFHFVRLELNGLPLVLLEIDCAYRHPVQFSGAEFIRIGSYKKRLKDFQEKERELWRVLDATPFERLPAVEKLSADEVLKRLDYPSYFDLIDRPLPDGRAAILDALAADRLIEPAGGGYWNVMNLGAILLAKQLSDFGRLQRKAVRVIVYKGKGRVETLREQTGAKGYAAGFEGLIGFINGLLPVNEVIGQALRKAVPVYPELAIRELVANALIHQDFSITGSGPMVEIFDDRMEITNPGLPLVDTAFAPRSLTQMDQADRVRAVYLHACLRYVQREFMTNSSLRERFGIDTKNSATASRLIKEALGAGMVRLHDPDAAPKLRRYVPSWA